MKWRLLLAVILWLQTNEGKKWMIILTNSVKKNVFELIVEEIVSYNRK